MHSGGPDDPPASELASGACALIVGGSGSIGRAVAARLTAMGYSIALAARRLEPLQEAVAGLPPSSARAFTCDLADPPSIEAMVRDVVAAVGRIDVLVHAAGEARPDFASRARPEVWEEMLRVHLVGTALCCRAVVPIMRKQGGGHVVLVGSRAGRDGMPGFAGYSAAKAGGRVFAACLRDEVARHGIRVTTLLPDRVDAPRQQADPVPTGVLSPLDVAEAVAFVLSLSPKASVREIVLDLVRPAE